MEIISRHICTCACYVHVLFVNNCWCKLILHFEPRFNQSQIIKYWHKQEKNKRKRKNDKPAFSIKFLFFHDLARKCKVRSLTRLIATILHGYLKKKKKKKKWKRKHANVPHFKNKLVLGQASTKCLIDGKKRGPSCVPLSWVVYTTPFYTVGSKWLD